MQSDGLPNAALLNRVLPSAGLANGLQPGHRVDHSGQEEAWFLQRRRFAAATEPGRLTELLRLLGTRPDGSVTERAVPIRRVTSGATLFHEGSSAEAIYVVQVGTFKCIKTTEEGYEQVLGFAGQGEVLGFDALCCHREAVSSVALEDAGVYVLPLRDLDIWRHQEPALDRALQLALSRQLARAGELAEMMSAVAAEVRLARFLTWQSARMAERGQSPYRLRLRMSRRDIASLLGVAHETVSRSFSLLAEWSYLRVDNREIEILDLDGLKTCTRSTRRPGSPQLHDAAHASNHGRRAAAA